MPFVTFASDLFQIEVSHLYNPAKNEFTLILHVPMVANSNFQLTIGTEDEDGLVQMRIRMMLEWYRWKYPTDTV